MAGRLNGKVALITGGGQGVGLGIARRFAREDAALVLTGRDAAKLTVAAAELEELGAAVALCPGDAGNRADAQAAVAQAIERFGGLDVVINNAQATQSGVLVEDIDDAIMELTVRSGLYGTLYHMQAAFPVMRERGGSIINFGSREGIMCGKGFGAYAATKEAIRALSRVSAREWGQYGIRVNVICPASLSPGAAAYLDAHPDEAEMYRKEIALGYFGDSEVDIGAVAVFLACEDGRYVTGQTINADGGQVML